MNSNDFPVTFYYSFFPENYKVLSMTMTIFDGMDLHWLNVEDNVFYLW